MLQSWVIIISLMMSWGTLSYANSDAELLVTNEFIGIEELDWQATPEQTLSHQQFDVSRTFFIAGIGGIDINSIIRVGKQIWDIIVGGYMEPTFRGASVSAVPDGITNKQVFSRLSGWSRPKAYKFKLNIKQNYGGNGVEFDYKVILSHGGKYNGKGNYLANARIVPDGHPKVKWAWKFDAKVVTQAPINMGSKDDPVAGIEMGLEYHAKPRVGKSRKGVKSFFLSGHGDVDEL